jgi:hypothetical protein
LACNLATPCLDHKPKARVATDRVGAEWQQLEGIIMNLTQNEFSKREIWAILPVGGSRISRLCKVLQNGIDTFHIRHPPHVPIHALYDKNLNTIKVDVKS